MESELKTTLEEGLRTSPRLLATMKQLDKALDSQLPPQSSSSSSVLNGTRVESKGPAQNSSSSNPHSLEECYEQQCSRCSAQLLTRLTKVPWNGVELFLLQQLIQELRFPYLAGKESSLATDQLKLLQPSEDRNWTRLREWDLPAQPPASWFESSPISPSNHRQRDVDVDVDAKDSPLPRQSHSSHSSAADSLPIMLEPITPLAADAAGPKQDDDDEPEVLTKRQVRRLKRLHPL